MLEKIFGSPTERTGFNSKVFTSWIFLGLIFGLIFGILGLGQEEGSDLFFKFLIAFPIVSCLFGLIGLGFTSIRGGYTEYPGWYWWIFPIVAWIAIGFGIFVGMIAFTLSLVGVNLPEFRNNSRSRPPNRDEFDKMTPKEVLEKFNKKFEELEKNNKLKPEERKAFRKLKGLDKNALRSDMKSALSDDEVELLFILLIKILSGDL